MSMGENKGIKAETGGEPWSMTEIERLEQRIADLERERDEWKDQAMKIGGGYASVLLENNNLKGSAFKIGTIANLESENATLRAKLAASEGRCQGLREGGELLRAEVEVLKKSLCANCAHKLWAKTSEKEKS